MYNNFNNHKINDKNTEHVHHDFTKHLLVSFDTYVLWQILQAKRSAVSCYQISCYFKNIWTILVVFYTVTHQNCAIFLLLVVTSTLDFYHISYLPPVQRSTYLDNINLDKVFCLHGRYCTSDFLNQGRIKTNCRS